jgi:hypothetical protein
MNFGAERSTGIPFFNITPVNMDIVVAADAILGDRVLSYQVANEPDYYGFNGRNHRQTVCIAR